MSLRNTILAFTIALTAGAFTLDYATGRDIDLWVLYLVPVALGSFALGARYGYALAVFAAAVFIESNARKLGRAGMNEATQALRGGGGLKDYFNNAGTKAREKLRKTDEE